MEKKIRILRIIELIIGFFSLFIFLAVNDINDEILQIDNSLVWIPFVVYIFFVIGLIIEYKNNYHPTIRTCILVIGLVLALVGLTESISFSSISLALIFISYDISLLFVCLKSDVVKVKPKIVGNDVLPDGVCFKSELNVMYIYWILIFILTMGITILLTIFEISFLWLILLIVIEVIAIYFVIKKSNYLIKVLNTINNDLDIDKFIELIDKALANNINLEMYNYLLIIKANYLFCYDKEKAISVFNQVHKPNNKKYLETYYSVKFAYELNMNNYLEASETIENINSLVKENFKNTLKVFSCKDEMLNIESIYKEDTKIMFNNIDSMYIKMIYYYTRNKVDLSIKIAKRLIEKVPNFYEYIKTAEKIINNEFDL